MSYLGRRSRVPVLAMLALGAVVGCGSPTPTSQGSGGSMETASLNELAEAYRVFSIAKKKPPQNIGELSTVEAFGGNGMDAVKKGEIIVLWGSKLPDLGEEPAKVPSPQVLAYWKDVPDKGGFVLLLDRTVVSMTPEEFKAAPKSGAS